jgi:hypothetical protein
MTQIWIVTASRTLRMGRPGLAHARRHRSSPCLENLEQRLSLSTYANAGVVEAIRPLNPQPLPPVVVETIRPLNPQPLPPVVVETIRPLNPQPLPPVVVETIRPLNPQPLPPVVVETIRPLNPQPLPPVVVDPTFSTHIAR